MKTTLNQLWDYTTNLANSPLLNGTKAAGRAVQSKAGKVLFGISLLTTSTALATGIIPVQGKLANVQISNIEKAEAASLQYMGAVWYGPGGGKAYTYRQGSNIVIILNRQGSLNFANGNYSISGVVGFASRKATKYFGLPGLAVGAATFAVTAVNSYNSQKANSCAAYKGYTVLRFDPLVPWLYVGC